MNPNFQDYKLINERTLSPFRSLENYKSQQAAVARDKGRLEELKAARSLTEARRIVYGR